MSPTQGENDHQTSQNGSSCDGKPKMNPIWSPWRMNYIMNHKHLADCVLGKR
jgi:hypothetical protein